MKPLHHFRRWALLALAACLTAPLALAQLPNAWQINDNTGSGGLQYQTNLSPAQVSEAMTNGWRYDLRSRMVSDSGNAAAHSMAFGNGIRRFYIFFDLNGAGELTAQLLGDSTYTLTNNPAWVATEYHWHQMTYDPVMSNATYRVDDVVIASWPGQVSVGQSNQVMWGANASAGQGVMNYHRAEFEIVGQGIMANYNAGTAGNPAIAPSPTNQAWLRFASGSLSELAISPDSQFVPVVTTLAADQITLSSARLNGQVNPSGAPTVAWFEWGTTMSYGNITTSQPVGQGSSISNLTALIGGLVVGSPYHFRLVASNEFGAVVGLNSSFVSGASFVQTPTVLTNICDSSVAWGDYDNDGLLDFLVTGELFYQSSVGITSNLWRNTGSGFTNVPIPGLPATRSGAVAWGDYDNDGRLDFLLTGNGITQLRRNTGTTFTNVPIPGLTGVSFSAVAWADYDNDGRLDFLLAGNGIATVQLWRNTATGFTNVTASVAPGLPEVFEGSIAWGDYDNDGRLDFLLAGGGISQLWRNTGSAFTNVPIAGLPGVSFGCAAWADYDNDGRLDFLLTGLSTSPISQLWRNTGNGFTNVPVAGLPGVGFSSVAWADYDSDGRLDFLLTGPTSGISGSISQIWRNTGDGFINVPVPGLPGVLYSSVAWADYDNDGRLDFILSGARAGLPAFAGAFQVWRNIHLASNSPPNAPTGLFVAPTGTHAGLTWNAASDAQTPAAALSYNLRVGTAPGASDIVSAQSLANGYRLGPGFGNVGSGTNRLVPVQFGVTHYWSVQTVDNGFAASPFSAEHSFTMNSVLTPTNGIPVPGDQNGDGVVSQSELSAVLTNLNGTGIVSESDLQLVLASYFPNSPWLHLTNVAGLGGTNVTFALTNSLAGAFSVEYTTNLVDWLSLGPATPRYQFTDTNATAVPQRYYRLRWP